MLNELVICKLVFTVYIFDYLFKKLLFIPTKCGLESISIRVRKNFCENVNSFVLEITIPVGGNKIMSSLPNCPKCNSEYTYEDGSLLVCPECGHEWTLELETENSEDQKVIKDSNGNVLTDGDTVTIIKDLKVKGSSSVLKVGTKVKNIRLVDGDHDIDCKIDGFGAMKLKSEFVKKV